MVYNIIGSLILSLANITPAPVDAQPQIQNVAVEKQQFLTQIEQEYQTQQQKGAFDFYFQSKKALVADSKKDNERANLEKNRNEQLRAIMESTPDHPVSQNIRVVLNYLSNEQQTTARGWLSSLHSKPVEQASDVEEAALIRIEDEFYCKRLLVDTARLNGKIDAKTHSEQVRILSAEKMNQFQQTLPTLKNSELKSKLTAALQGYDAYQVYSVNYKTLVDLGRKGNGKDAVEQKATVVMQEYFTSVENARS